jgi:hypothetical protein
MGVCITADIKEQVEILLPDGRKVIIVVLPTNNRVSINNTRLAFVAPKDIEIQRRPRKSSEENNMELYGKEK